MARQSSRSAAGAEADGARAVRHWPGRKPNGEVGVGRRFIAAPGAGRAGPGWACLGLLDLCSVLFYFLSKVHLSSWGFLS